MSSDSISDARTRRVTESRRPRRRTCRRAVLFLSLAPTWRRAYTRRAMAMQGARVGVTMSLYRSIATAVGTREALDLAHRLAVWHDAMVVHRRRAGDEAGPSCAADCPHEQAA